MARKLKKGDLVKIWTNPLSYGIFDSYSTDGKWMYFIDSTLPEESERLLSRKINQNRHSKATELPSTQKVSVLNNKNFDKHIARFGLCVREGFFCDRLTMTEITVLKLSRAFEDLRSDFASTRIE